VEETDRGNLRQKIKLYKQLADLAIHQEIPPNEPPREFLCRGECRPLGPLLMPTIVPRYRGTDIEERTRLIFIIIYLI
jgi:hypothetical protein